MLIKLLAVYLILTAIVSLVAFAVYGWDKRQARHSGVRIPESRLHQLAACGGWPGALLGQHYFRHKTSKPGFRTKTWAIAAAHLVLLAAIVWLFV